MAHAIIKINGGNLRYGGFSEEFASVSTAPVHILPSFFLDNDKVAAFSASFALTSRASHKENPARRTEGEGERGKGTSSKLTKQKFNIRDATTRLNYQVEWLFD